MSRCSKYTVNNASYYSNASYHIVKRLQVKINKDYEGKIACNCQKIAAIASNLLLTLQETEVWKKENETCHQLIKKIQEKTKDFNENIQEYAPEMERIYEKVNQTVMIFEKERSV